MIYHIVALLAGFIVDLCIGDPLFFPHPVRAIGALIASVERHLLRDAMSDKEKMRAGRILVAIVCTVVFIISTGILITAYYINRYAGCIIETIMTWQILAVKSLRVESMKVYDRLKSSDLQGARVAVSMIVGRDTDALDEAGVAKAAVETVAENTSDGVVAPLIYTALGGPILGMLYKAVNTMDSMVGYKNDRYMYYGRSAARLDDMVNYIPARISALIMIIASGLIPGCSMKDAWKVFKRDRFNHASPNSAQTEAVCAGAIGVRLAGDAYYFGRKVSKPYIGDDKRAIVYNDIKLANALMTLTSVIGLALCEIILTILYIIT